jgi:hypothetical protein
MITWTITEEVANAILGVLGNLPTSSGAFPILMDLKQQTESQTVETKED